MGLSGIEPETSRLSGARSNRLSYKPLLKKGCSRKLNRIQKCPHLMSHAHINLLKQEAICDVLLRKEVIQPQVPLRLPCYDFTPVTSHTMGGYLPCGLTHRLPVQLASMV